MIALLIAATITIPAPKFKKGDAVIYYSKADCPKGCPGEVTGVTYSEGGGWNCRGEYLGRSVYGTSYFYECKDIVRVEKPPKGSK